MRPLIFIRSYHTEPDTVQAGSTFELFLELHNVGSIEAQNIIITFVGGDFTPLGTSSVKTIGKLSVDEHGWVSQKFQAPSDMENGLYPQAVQIDYDDRWGTHYSSSETVGISVTGVQPEEPSLIIGWVSVKPELITPGKEFTLTLAVRNVGGNRARNVLVTVVTASPFAPLKAGNVRALGDIEPGKAAWASFQMITDRRAEAGAYNQKILLEYEDEEGQKHSSSYNTGIIVAPSMRKRPHLLLTRYQVTPVEPSPGEVFTLTLTLENVGDGSAHNIIVNFDLGDEFAILNSGGMLYLSLLQEGNYVQLEQPILISAMASSGVYRIPVKVEYEDQEGTAFSHSQDITVMVLRKPLLRVDFYEPITQVIVGQPFLLPVEVINIGKDTVNVTTVELQSEDVDITDGSMYIGTLDGGTSGTIEATGIARKPGIAAVRVVVHYVDDFNRLKEVVKELKVEVAETPPLPEIKETPQPGEVEEKGVWGRIWSFIKALFGLGG